MEIISIGNIYWSDGEYYINIKYKNSKGLTGTATLSAASELSLTELLNVTHKVGGNHE